MIKKIIQNNTSIQTKTVYKTASGTTGAMSADATRKVGVDSDGRINRTIVKFNNLPTIDSKSIITDAKLILTKHFANDKPICAHKIISATELNQINWATTNSSFYDSEVIDVLSKTPSSNPYNGDQEANYYYLDLTSYIQDIVNGANDYGIMLKSASETELSSSLEFKSENLLSTEENYLPCLVINYKLDEDIDQNANQTVELGRAGKSTVNLLTGNLTFTHKDENLLNVTHVYNGRRANSTVINDEGMAISTQTGMGKGWHINYQQYFKLAEDPLQEYPKAVYIDGTGNKHYFKKLEIENTMGEKEVVYVDTENLGLIYYCSNAIMIDKNNNQYQFDTTTALKKITDIFGREINIIYSTADKIDKITDSQNRSITFTYQNNRVSKITDPSGRETTYTYDANGNLVKIAYPDTNNYFDTDKATTKFAYDSSNRLVSVTDRSGVRVEYTYNNDGKIIKVKECSTYKEISADGTQSYLSTDDPDNREEWINIKYLSKNKRVVQNKKGIKTVYIFDGNGKIITCYEDIESFTSSTSKHLSPTGNISFNGNGTERIVSCNVNTSKINKSNLIANPGFEGYLFGYFYNWMHEDSNGLTGDQSNEEVAFENYNCKIVGDITKAKKVDQSIDKNKFTAGKIYILSGWGKASSAVAKKGLDSTFRLRAVLSYSDTTEEYVADFDSKNKDWQFTATAFKVKTGLISATVSVEYDYNVNVAYFDNIALTEGNANVMELKIVNKNYVSQQFKLNEITKIRYGESSTNCTELIVDGFELTASDIQRTLNDFYKKGVTASNRQSQVYVNDGVVLGVTANSKYIAYGQDNDFIPLNLMAISYVVENKNGTASVDTIIEGADQRKVKSSIVKGTETFTETSIYNNLGQLVKKIDIRGVVTENSYDQFGNITNTYVKNPLGTKYVITEKEYSTDGNYLLKEYDERRRDSQNNDICVSYDYNAQKNLQTKTTTPNGQEINYTYNNNNDSLEKISSTNGTDENYNDLVYNLDHLVEMISVGTVYDFTYDGFGRPLKVLKNGIEYLEKEHISSTTQDVEKTTYGNGEKFTTTYDKYGNVVNVKYNNANLETFTYGDIYDTDNSTINSASKLTTHIDNSAGITYNYTYEDEKLKSVEQIKNGQRVLKITDSTEEERLVNKEYAYSDTDKLTYNFEYEKKNGVVIPDNKAVGVSVENTFNSTVSYDDLGRVSGKNFLAGGVERSTTYAYEDSTLPMDVPYPVERCTNYITSETDGTNTTNYTYDKNGNITRITTPSGIIQYSYDNLNRLQTEVNNILGKTYNYTYDREGNILTKSTLNHSTNRTSSYTYGYDSNKLLTSYNGTPIAYDSLGNISSYYYSFSWEKGHLLKSLTDRMDFNISFEYNAQGLRTRKNDQYNGKDHKYIYDGDKLVREVIVDSNNAQKVLNYYYDASGICGFSYDGVNYFYKKNILGDILAIYNQSGTVVAEYAYDAFGNCTILSNTNDIANINPIRYRGYYYDTEFRLYYLKSRYYSPELGRFISPDSIDYLEPETINGLNLYAYCLNNPVMYADPTGHFVFITALLISMGIAAGIGATLAGISAYQSGERGWDLFADIIGGAIFGAAIGATIALGGAAGLAAVGGSVAGFGLSTGVALGISIGVTTIAGMTKYSLDCVNSSENNWNFGGFVLSGIESALQGIATFGLAYLGGKAGFFNKWGNFKGWYDFYLGYGGMNNLKMISYLSNLIIGPTLSKALFVSGSAALARWLIDLIIPDLY